MKRRRSGDGLVRTVIAAKRMPVVLAQSLAATSKGNCSKMQKLEGNIYPIPNVSQHMGQPIDDEARCFGLN